jgi:hypothetical protein
VTAVVLAEGAAIVLLTVLVAGLLRSHAEILKSLHELGAGLEGDRAAGPVPIAIDAVGGFAGGSPSRDVPGSLVGETLDGESIAVPLVASTDTLIAFLSAGCSSCEVVWREFADASLTVPGNARLVVVSRDADDESISTLRSVVPGRFAHVLSSEAWEAFDVPGSPYFAYVDAGGRLVGEGTAVTWPHVTSLIRQALADRLATVARSRDGS